MFSDLLLIAFARCGHTAILFDVAGPKRVATYEVSNSLLAKLGPADLTIECHLDASSDPSWRSGIVLHQRNERAAQLALAITRAADATMPWPMRAPVPWDAPDYGRAEQYFTRAPEPAVIFEAGFITHDRAREWLFDPENAAKLAEALARAV